MKIKCDEVRSDFIAYNTRRLTNNRKGFGQGALSADMQHGKIDAVGQFGGNLPDKFAGIFCYAKRFLYLSVSIVYAKFAGRLPGGQGIIEPYSGTGRIGADGECRQHRTRHFGLGFRRFFFFRGQSCLSGFFRQEGLSRRFFPVKEMENQGGAAGGEAVEGGGGDVLQAFHFVGVQLSGVPPMEARGRPRSVPKFFQSAPSFTLTNKPPKEVPAKTVRLFPSP